MSRPTLAETGRFLAILFGVLLIDKLLRIAFFDGSAEALGGIDVMIAIAAGVLVMGGWLSRSRPEA